MKKFCFLIFLIPLLLGAEPREARRVSSLAKTTATDYNNYTTVGQIGMTITNFGLLGEGWNNPDQPSCRYKQYADIQQNEVEHFSYAGLWIGGVVKGSKRVTTSIVDGVFDYGAQGFEISTSKNPADTIKIKSSLTTDKYFSPKATSHQDFICDYNDFDPVVNHQPMGIRVHQESYAWSYSFADAFVILDITIYNESHLMDEGGSGWDIENLFAGIWADASVANMNYTSIYEPGGGFTWYDNLDGFDQTLFDPNPDDNHAGYARDIAYQYDKDGDNGYAQSYIGFRILGNSQVPRTKWDSYYRQWVWSSSSNMDYPNYIMPVDDDQRYQFMQESVPINPGGTGYNSNGYPNQEDSWIFLLSGGPFGAEPTNIDSTNWVLHPGDSVRIAMAVTCAQWGNNSLTDNEERKSLLYANSDWAQKAYNGEDRNGNGILEPDEDSNNNGKMDRYILPAPPPSPNLKVISESNKITLYWGKHPESVPDPLTRQKDFEGYRIYAHRKTASESNSQWSLLAQYDLKNELGYNTGFDYIRIKSFEADGMDEDSCYYKIIDKDTVYYKYVNTNVKSGWPEKYVYSVTSFDSGDPTTGLKSLESNKINNRTYVISGKKPQQSEFSDKVGVYPNPYKGRTTWDGYGERDRMIWFYNLPDKAKVKIFTISGDLVDEFEHNSASYDGSDISRLNEISQSNKIVFSGGEHAWDLITKWDQAVASGLYIFTVKDMDSGNVQRGKFLIVK
ncbi:MAG: hypothetical protein K9M80_03315 [Candidatus Marinimicrobia bacterium]|nr:hypothetical protein [Candidatus Neomarinimicrobiota bacterium]